MSAARRQVPEHLAGNRYVRFGGPVSFGWLSDDFGDDGVIGDPTAGDGRARRRAVRRRRRRRSARRSPRSPPSSTVTTPMTPSCASTASACGRASSSSARSAPSRDPTARRAAPAWPSPTPTARGATSSSGGCATSACTSPSTPSATSSPRAPGTDPSAAPVMTGSHIDTVATGGRFDGNLGVLAGLEVIETLEQHGVATDAPDRRRLLHRRGGRPLRAGHARQPRVRRRAWRSRRRSTCAAVDDGARLGDELARIGYAGPLPCPTAVAPHAYVELHIEQGPILEDEGITIGVVEGVQGISWTELTISGRSAHAGTTPMRLRRDAGYVAAAIATFARRLATRARRRPGGDRRPVRGAPRPRQRRARPAPR